MSNPDAPHEAPRARHYSAAELTLDEDVPGARLWAVALERAMLTRFQVDPGARFEEHQHESEQITLVLSGTLVFEVGGRSIPVKAGEVIALPSNVPHAAYALDEPVEAVDAWSPPRGRYTSG